MRHLALSLSLLALVGCQGPSSGVTAVPGHGAISIAVAPNPIIATQVSGNTYDFPFEVIVRETAGRPVTVTRVSVNVFLPGGISVGSESWDAERIRSMGYATNIGGHGELRYRFTPRKSVPDERIFNGVAAELKVEAVDDTGTSTSATTAVTVRRG